MIIQLFLMIQNKIILATIKINLRLKNYNIVSSLKNINWKVKNLYFNAFQNIDLSKIQSLKQISNV
jgi:hypothetical protein